MAGQGTSSKKSGNRRSLTILILEILITVGACAAFFCLSIRMVSGTAAQFVKEIKTDYQKLEDFYLSVFKAVTIPIKEKVDEAVSFDEMQSYLYKNDGFYAEAVGPEVFDGLAITYRGSYAHSWDYGDYTNYDPTTRIWYQQAQKAEGKAILVAPYTSYLSASSQKAGQILDITIAQKYNDEVSFDLDIKISGINALIGNRNLGYPGTKILFYNRDGYVLSSTDSGDYNHNIYEPDEVVSADFAAALSRSKNSPDHFLFLNAGNGKSLIYSASDSKGNTYAILIPWTSLLFSSLFAGFLIALLLILLEIAIYVRNTRAMSDIRRTTVRQKHIMEEIAEHYDAVITGNAFSGAVDIIRSKFLPEKGAKENAGQAGFVMKHIMPEYRKAYANAVRRSTIRERLKTSQGYDTMFRMDDGHWKVLRIIRDEDYVRNGSYIIFIEDADEAMKHQQEMREACDRANAATRAKSEFLSRMSHDIRTPLNGIIGMTYLASKEKNPPATQEYLGKIDISSKFLLGLVNDVLDMSKVESNRMELKPEPYSLELMKNYLSAVIIPLCESRHITLKMYLEPVRDVCIMIDVLHSNQVLFNLFSNAVKYTPEGGTISFRFLQKQLDNGKMDTTIVIADTGIGMSEEFQKVLFEPFTQENRSDISEQRGTGLGLAIVKKMVDLIGGTISVQSTPGKGTTFTLHGVFDAVPFPEKAEETKADSEEEQTRLLFGKSVLVFEDHPMNQEIIRRLLEMKRMKVTIADSGEKGLEILRSAGRGAFDLILMDIRMPGISGYEAAERIRKMERSDLAGLPIIAMTADAFREDREKCMKVGMNGYAAKPINPGELYRTMAEFVGTVCCNP